MYRYISLQTYFFPNVKKHLALQRKILNVILFTSINISWCKIFCNSKIYQLFFPLIYYTSFETKLGVSSIHKATGKRSKEKRELLYIKEKNPSLLFWVEMFISTSQGLLNCISVHAAGKSVYFSCVLKRIVYLPGKQTNKLWLHMQISFPKKTTFY